MSPKIVNGSFAAIFDNGDNVLEEFAKAFSRFRLEVKDSPGKLRSRTKILTQHCYMIRYDFVLTAIGFPPGGSGR